MPVQNGDRSGRSCAELSQYIGPGARFVTVFSTTMGRGRPIRGDRIMQQRPFHVERVRSKKCEACVILYVRKEDARKKEVEKRDRHTGSF